MTVQEIVGILVFAAALATVYVAAAIVAVRWVSRRVRRQPAEPRGAARRWSRRAVMAIAAIGVLCGLYARLVEPYWPEVTHIEIASAKLPAGAKPIRIVHLSDTHCDEAVRLAERLPEMAKAAEPDLIVFTGDAVNSPAGLPNFRRLMASLAEIAPVYAIRGNWDRYSPAELYGQTGVTLLAGHTVTVDVRGVKLRLLGWSAGQTPQALATLGALDSDTLTIALCHRPDPILEVAATGRADVQLSGHTHGGQVALPFYGALLTLSRHGKRFESGRYRVEQTTLYVSRGIGMEGGPAPRIRFLARPEIAVVEIRPE